MRFGRTTLPQVGAEHIPAKRFFSGADSVRDGSTVDGFAEDGSETFSGRRAQTRIVLTILSHPDLRRAGERAVLRPADEPAYLSRRSPDFSAAAALWQGGPLDDPYLSRRPWGIEPMDDGVVLRRMGSPIELRVDGKSVDETVQLSAQALRSGVVLELGRRVALWLQLEMGPSIERDADRELRARSQIIGQSSALEQAMESVRRLAGVDVAVLIRGEAGTGKTLIAEALHRHSPRAAKPFVTVDLGALSSSAAVSELWEQIQAADGGVLFLDQLGEAAPEIQRVLSRFLGTGKVMPSGSRAPRPVDVRIVAAADVDLEAKAAAGDFKSSLLHRLSAYRIHLPALRDRREDIGALFLHFARQALDEVGAVGLLDGPDPRSGPWLSPSLMRRLARYVWPGNVRQLRNVVRRLVIDGRDDGVLRPGFGLQTLLAGPGCPNASSLEKKGGGEIDAEQEATWTAPPVSRRESTVEDATLKAAFKTSTFEPSVAARIQSLRRAFF